MKYLLATLLIVLVFGCKDKGKSYETRSTFIFGTDTLDMNNCGQFNFDKWRAGHFNGNGHNDTTDRVFYDTFRVQCHDTVFIHDTVYTSKHYGNVENLIIGPQPSPLPDTTKPLNIKMQPRFREDNYGDMILGGTTSTTIDSFISKWRDASKATRGGITITGVPSKPTDMLLVCDTSQVNGFLSSRVYWVYGYGSPAFLDQYGKPFPKNIVVWMTKELR